MSAGSWLDANLVESLLDGDALDAAPALAGGLGVDAAGDGAAGFGAADD